MSDQVEQDLTKKELIEITADIVVSYVSANTIAEDKLSALMQSVFDKVTSLNTDASDEEDDHLSRQEIAATVTSTSIRCLECSGKFKTLRRHLKSTHEMAPEAYIEKWSLPLDYPMVAKATSAKRSDVAKSFGFGTKDFQAETKKATPKKATSKRSKAKKKS